MNISAGYVFAVVIPDNGNQATLAVGKQHDGKMEIINAFSGEEAIQLCCKLIGTNEVNLLMTKKEIK